MHAAHSLRGLHSQRSHRSDTVAVMSRECFQVGRNSCAARRIEPGNSQENGRRVTGVIIQFVRALRARHKCRRHPDFWVRRPFRNLRALSAATQHNFLFSESRQMTALREEVRSNLKRSPPRPNPQRLREQAADESGFGYAADGEHVRAGAHVRAMLAHHFVDVLERAAHDAFELGIYFAFCPEKPL